MSEACEAVTAYCFDILESPVLRAAKAIANPASRHISEIQGMCVVATEDREYVSGQLPLEICELTADEWCAHKWRR
jgi:RimJ/RimL family protein N-acetyltransferase